MRKVWRSEAIGEHELTIIKRTDGFDDLFAGTWAAAGLAVAALSSGWLGWGPDASEGRWLVQLRELRTGHVRTVASTFTRLGARHAARRVRTAVISADEQAIRALPDLGH